MAATEQVLSTLARLGNIGLGGVETPDNRPSEQDSSLFSALLEESGGGNRPPEEKTAGRKADDDGNGLPALPVAVPVPPPPPERPVEQAKAEDSDLEEFAVRLGIDRSLARLLLTQTAGAPAVDATMAPVATPDVAGFSAVFQAAAPSVVAKAGMDPDAAATAVSTSTKLGSADFMASLLAAAAAPINAATDGVANAAVGPTATADVAAMSATSDSETAPTLSQLDLARLVGANAEMRGAVRVDVKAATAPTVSTVAATAAILPPALSAVPESVTSIAAAPLGDEDLLRWRSVAARAEPSVPAAIAAANDEAAANEDIAAEVVTTLTPGMKDRLATKDAGKTANTRAERTRDVASGKSAGADEMLALSSLRSLALEQNTGSTSVVDFGAVAPVVTAATSSVDPNGSFAGLVVDAGASSSLAPSNASGASGGIMNEPLRMPEPKFDFAMRAEMFADQVAQRVLGQIRNQAYDVSLQLDPRNLGPMDISLRVDGSQVTANVAVTHPEVRSLLESGLPRLRESLESAGLSLTNWSFAQSGSRDPSSAHQRGSSAAGEMRRVARVADEADVGIVATAVTSGSNRAVDLFV